MRVETETPTMLLLRCVERLETVHGSSGAERYEAFGKLDQAIDELTRLVLYPNGCCPNHLLDNLRALGNLHHNAVNGFCTARGFAKKLATGEVFTSQRKDGAYVYTLEMMQGVIDRNDDVAVVNFKDIITLLRDVIEAGK